MLPVRVVADGRSLAVIRWQVKDAAGLARPNGLDSGTASPTLIGTYDHRRATR